MCHSDARKHVFVDSVTLVDSVESVAIVAFCGNVSQQPTTLYVDTF